MTSGEPPLRLLRHALWVAARTYRRVLPATVKVPTENRRLLERVVFRAVFVDPRTRAVLFVGCAGYTAWYPAMFRLRPGLRFATVDPDPSAAIYGSPGDHRVERFQSLLGEPGEHDRYDVVFLNGVFGYGVDVEADQRLALDTAHAVLRRGGRMVIGFGETEIDPSRTLELVDATRFVAAQVPGLEVARPATAGRSEPSFACYVKI